MIRKRKRAALRVVYCASEPHEPLSVPLANELSKLCSLLLIVSYPRNKTRPVQAHRSSKFVEAGVLNHTIQRKGRSRSPIQLFYDCILVNQLMRFKPDVAIIDGVESPYLLLFYPLMRLWHIHVIFVAHNVVPHSGFGNLFYELFKWLSIRIADDVLVFSKNQSHVLWNKYHIRGLMVPHPYIDFYEHFYRERKIGREPCTILFFGVIRPNKGLEILIQAAEAARNQIPNLKVIIAGECPDFSRYRGSIRTPSMFELHLERIPDEEVGMFFLRSQFLVLPYHDATQSGPLMISLGFNCPVIASNVGSFAEFIDSGETGLLFEKGNSEELAESIVFLLTHMDILKRMQEISRQRVSQNFSVSSVAHRLLDISFEACSKQSG